MGLFKDSLALAFNTIGRYYQGQLIAYRGLYDLLWDELNCIY